MKLRELKDDYSREEEVEKRAKEYFKRELVANLQKVLSKSNISQATPPSTTTTVPATTAAPELPAESTASA